MSKLILSLSDGEHFSVSGLQFTQASSTADVLMAIFGLKRVDMPKRKPHKARKPQKHA